MLLMLLSLSILPLTAFTPALIAVSFADTAIFRCFRHFAYFFAYAAMPLDIVVFTRCFHFRWRAMLLDIAY